MVLAVIKFLGSPDSPDNELPGGGHADQDLPGGPAHPGHALPPWVPQPPRPWPPRVTDPEWGVGHPLPPHPGFIPGSPLPGFPDNSLPVVPGHPAPPIAGTPPGTIWPPLPVINPPAPPGPAALLVWLVGVGWRYVIVEIPVATPTDTNPC